MRLQMDIESKIRNSTMRPVGFKKRGTRQSTNRSGFRRDAHYRIGVRDSRRGGRRPAMSAKTTDGRKVNQATCGHQAITPRRRPVLTSPLLSEGQWFESRICKVATHRITPSIFDGVEITATLIRRSQNSYQAPPTKKRQKYR